MCSYIASARERIRFLLSNTLLDNPEMVCVYFYSEYGKHIRSFQLGRNYAREQLGRSGLQNPCRLILTRSSVSGNMSRQGGGITNRGTLTLDDSTVGGNTSSVIGGGGIYNGGSLLLNNSTVSGNTDDRGLQGD